MVRDFPEDEGHGVKKHEGENPGESATGDPLQLLAQDAARRAAITEQENEGGHEKVHRRAGVIRLVEPDAGLQRRNKIEKTHGDVDVYEKNQGGNAVDEGQLGRQAAAPLGKNEREMHQQRRLKKHGDDVGPVNGPVERIQFAGVVKGVENEGDQAENIKVDGARRGPAAHKNEQADKEINEPEDAQIVFNGGRLFGRDGDQLDVEYFSGALDLVARLEILAQLPERPGDLRRAVDFGGIDGADDVTALDAGLGRWGIRSDVPGFDARRGVDPGDAVVRSGELQALLEVQAGKNDGGESKNRQQYRAEPHSQAIVHSNESSSDTRTPRRESTLDSRE